MAPQAPKTGVLALARRPVSDLDETLSSRRQAPIILLEAPAHLGNVGAVIRSAAAAGAGGVLTTGHHDPWDPAALRGSAGLHFAQPVLRVDQLPPSDRPLLAIHPDGDPMDPSALPARAVLAFGSERKGLSPALLERADRLFAIPMEAPGLQPQSRHCGGGNALCLALASAKCLNRCWTALGIGLPIDR